MRNINQRHKKLLALLESKGETPVEELAAFLNVSEATLRRDLVALENEKKVVRSFGGARIADPSSLVAKAFEKKREEMRREKEIIARKAAEFVSPGMIVGIDSGTTAWRAAAALKDKAPLTVITNALAPIEELGAVKGITIYCTGGDFRLTNLDFIGPGAVEAYSSLHADIALISGDSFIPEKGVFTADTESAGTARALSRCAEQTIALITHNKFYKIAPFLVVPSEKISSVITDSRLNQKTIQSLKNEPFDLVVAD